MLWCYVWFNVGDYQKSEFITFPESRVDTEKIKIVSLAIVCYTCHIISNSTHIMYVS